MEKSTSSKDSKDSVNLFTEPHSRMKELVSWPLTQASKVSDVHELEPSLQAIYEAMWEMKSHEYIENHYIMDQLKQRLQSRRVYNEVVCNCHEDSKLLDVIALVERVYQADTQRERVKYGRRLQKAIKSFLHEFIHHMEEEESVFQPLLNENFDSKELKDMKEIVQKQHSLFREKVKSEKSLKALKRKRPEDSGKPELDLTLDDLRFKKSYCQEVSDFLKKDPDTGTSNEPEEEVVAKKSKTEVDTTETAPDPATNFTSLPEEILVLIFSHLSPRELLSCGGVNRLCRKIVFSSVFWKALYPTQWARGIWSFDYIPVDPRAEEQLLEGLSKSSSAASSLSSSIESLTDDQDDNASGDNQEADENGKVFNGIGKYLLPRIGWSVSTMILSACSSLTDQHVNLLLKQVPNVRHVNLGFTAITSESMNGLHKHNALKKVEELILTGCSRITDTFFWHWARCYNSKGKQQSRSKTKRLNLSGCRSLTSVSLEHLAVHATVLQELDLSGCYKIDGITLTLFVNQCPRLRPEKLSYCNDIEDGPFQETANGCLNLECEFRFCCQRLKN